MYLPDRQAGVLRLGGEPKRTRIVPRIMFKRYFSRITYNVQRITNKTVFHFRATIGIFISGSSASFPMDKGGAGKRVSEEEPKDTKAGN